MQFNKLEIQGLHHLALLVRDLARCEDFYCRVLQLPVEKRWHHQDGTLRSVWMRLPSGELLMLEQQTASSCNQNHGWHLVALRTALEQRQHAVEYLAQHGVTIESETDYTIYFRDPENNRVALSHWPEKKF